MSNVSKRAFQREGCKVKITFSIFKTDKHFCADMLNCGQGGLYFESDVNIAPGSDIYIKMENYSPEIHGLDAYDGYRAEVLWCRKLYKEDKSVYGVGARFMVNTCGQCGQTVSYDQIHKTESLLFLCTDCLDQIESIPQGQLKECLEDYLLGNVL